jgi:hypothetical protein
MIIKLVSGDILTCLEYGGKEFFVKGKILPKAPCTYNGNTITCNASTWDVTGNCDLTVSQTDFIVDDNVVVFNNAIGGRPRNIYRR